MSAINSIKAIDGPSVHRITSGQVVIDLQTAVKELVENSIDAGATNIEVRFTQYGLTSIQVIDNGSGIAPEDYDSIALKHYTSKLKTFADLTSVLSFGFRGEALSSLCALCEGVSITTARAQESPVGAGLVFDKHGVVQSKGPVARQRGTTITLTNLFTPLPVRRKELERNIKREFGKALALLNAYALGPCAKKGGIRLGVTNQVEGGRKSVQIRTDGTPSLRASVSTLWGPKALTNIVDLELEFEVETAKVALQRMSDTPLPTSVPVKIHGLTSKFAVGCGRTGTDRQFFYVNGRPCNMGKIQKAFNETYRSFNANQSPFLVVDVIIPTESCDVNVSPDKRTVFIHSEENLVTALKACLEETFAGEKSTFEMGGLQMTQTQLPGMGTPTQLSRMGTQTLVSRRGSRQEAAPVPDEEEEEEEEEDVPISRLNKTKIGKAGRVVESDEDEETPAARSLSSNKRRQATTRGLAGSYEDEDEEIQEVLDSSLGSRGQRSRPADAGSARRASRSRPDSQSQPETTHMDVDVDVDSDALDGDTNTRKPTQRRKRDGMEDLDDDPSDGIDALQKSTATRQKSANNEDSDRGPSDDLDPELNDDLDPELDTSIADPDISSRRRLTTPPTSDLAPSTSILGSKQQRSSIEAPTSSKPLSSSKPPSSSKPLSSTEPPSSSKQQPFRFRGSASVSTSTTHQLPSISSFRRQASMATRSPSSVMKSPSIGASPSTRKRRESDQTTLSTFGASWSQQVRRGSVSQRDDPGAASGEEKESGDDMDELQSPPRKRRRTSLAERGASRTPVAERRGGGRGEPLFLADEEEASMDVDAEVSFSSAARNVGTPSERDPDTSEDVIDLSFLESDEQSDVSSSTRLVEFLRDSEDNEEEVTLRFDIDRARDAYANSAIVLQVGPPSQGDRSSDAPLIAPEASVANTDDNDKAADALSRVIGKGDFGLMEILAQFNRGFIIARRRMREQEDEEASLAKAMDDLFIVDQHASDEKYNFETLQQTTQIQSQKLFKPLPLELTAADELLALDHLAVLEQNGFEFRVEDDRPVGQKLLVTAQPVSKDTSYTLKDLEELILLLHDAPPGRVVRCSKARAMFASRACRKSVMIGRSLTTSQMTTIVRHMGTMDQPWNCPHGRPTMRHLSNISSLGTGVREYRSRRVAWEKLPVFDA